MRATYISSYGGNEVIASGQLPDPVRRDDELLVEVHAAGVNPVEIPIRDGQYKRAMRLSFPQIMGFDISGVVRAAPVGGRFSEGDEVYARLPTRTMGAYAELVAIPADLAAAKPVSLSHPEAAGLPTVALTTCQALTERAGLKRGQRLLVQAAAGGVGTFAVQLAHHLGAEVIGTAGPDNHDFLRQLGVDEVIDYHVERFEDRGPYDVVYDGVGGELITRSIASVRRGGSYIGLVRSTDARAYREAGVPGPLARLAARGTAAARRQAAAGGVAYHGPLTRPDGRQLARIAALVDEGTIRPVVSETFALGELGRAYDALAGGHVRGKLVVAIG
ncbi:NADP-dependent oxidoreductase [Streptomyces sp. NPDC048636]|uniref:NADP-dependent oxidoreductase n=1 Tax=Streptomyces sp. NPDC048636 TaxID=3155762 RepID=UPI003415FDAD